jgi:hypothetical protein
MKRNFRTPDLMGREELIDYVNYLIEEINKIEDRKTSIEHDREKLSATLCILHTLIHGEDQP